MSEKDEWEVIRGGLDSLAWLLNNAHNHDAENWPDLVKAAHEDRDRALIALDVLRLQNEKNALERIEEAEKERDELIRWCFDKGVGIPIGSFHLSSPIFINAPRAGDQSDV